MTTAPRSAFDDDARILEGEPAEVREPREWLIREAAAMAGRAPADIEREMDALAYGPGGLTGAEYVRYRLFDDRDVVGDKAAFAGERATRAVWSIANFSPTWYGALGDKVACGIMLAAHGIGVPRTLALLGAGAVPEGVIALEDRADLARFLMQPAFYPMFGKPRAAERSQGAISLVSCDVRRGRVLLLDGRAVTAAALASEIHASYGAGYIFQSRLVPDAAVEALCGARVATLRVYTAQVAEGPRVLRVVWKIPGAANMADNYWRAGNILAQVDLTTGRVMRAVSGMGFQQQVLRVHPDTRMALVGAVVPQLQAAMAVALRAADVFRDIRLIGWDIAATRDGPVVVEGNFAPDFGLTQIADRRGMMDDALGEVLGLAQEAREQFRAAVREAQARQG